MIFQRRRLLYIGLTILLILITLLHLHHGSLALEWKQIWKSLFDFDPTLTSDVVFREIRIPRTLMAILAGSGLSIAGLLMQTYFNNPLAGPSVLGITSGSSLFVALTILSGWQVTANDYGLVLSALLGAFVFSLLILGFSYFVKSAVSLLLIGMMLGGFTSAIIQVIQLSTNANDLKAYILWGFGSLQQVGFHQLPFILIVFFLGVLSLISLIKPLNLMVLGESQARLLGTNIKLNRLVLIGIASIFAGLITAYCGPISFIGLAVPNIVKQIFKTQQHQFLLIGCALAGAITLIFCDLCIIYLEDLLLLPLNAITALIGSPIVVWIILKKF